MAFAGKWETESQEGYDEFCKLLGERKNHIHFTCISVLFLSVWTYYNDTIFKVSLTTLLRRAATTSWSQKLPRMAMTSLGPRSTPQMPRSPTSSPLARSAIWRQSVERNSRCEEIIQTWFVQDKQKKGRGGCMFADWLKLVFSGHSVHGGRKAERDLPQLPPHLWDQRRQAHRGKHIHVGF